MVSHLDEHVAGQDRAKRDLAAAVYRHYLGLASRDAKGEDFGPQHLLLLGPTGCGKTLLVRTLAAHLGVPVAFCAATSMVEAGYVGEQVESALVALMAAAGGDRKRAERGIVFLDEFDKVRRSTGVDRDVSGEGVQNALLSLFDGTRSRFRVRDQEIALDTSRILFVCAGAFADLPDVVRRRVVHKGGMGFGSRVRSRRTLSDAEAIALATPADLVAYGLIPELVGRFATVAALRPLSGESLVHILGGVRGSVLGRWERQFALHGLQLVVTPEASRAVAERALELGTGARGLARLVNEALRPVAWRLPELSASGIRAVRIAAGTVLGADEPELLSTPPEPETARSFPTADELRVAALAGHLFEEEPSNPLALAKLEPAKVAIRVQSLKTVLRFQHLRCEALEAWLDFEGTCPPHLVLWALRMLRERGLYLDTFTRALREAGTRHLPALVHYAAYLEARRAGEKPEAPPPRTRKPAKEPEAPKLDL
jgi:ATP-dependent Clp protease ATP-binding subunit ClpX